MTIYHEQDLSGVIHSNLQVKHYRKTVNNLGVLTGGSQSIDLTLGNFVVATISTASQSFTFDNPVESGINESFELLITNGGSQFITWPSSVNWLDNGEPPSFTPIGTDLLKFFTIDGGTNWYGSVIALNIKNSYKSIVELASQDKTSLILAKSGEIFTWGDSNLGNNEASYAHIPAEVYGNHTFCKIAATSDSGMGLDNNGQAWAWGTNTDGKLGDNTTVSKCTPVAVCGGHTFCEISGNTDNSLAIDTNGQAWAWGSNDNGQLGDGTTTNRCTPVAVCGAYTFCSISIGSKSMLGIDNHGQAWGWGYDKQGELGSGTNFCASTPLAVCGGHSFCQVCYRFIGLDANGQAWAWGENGSGELGVNYTTTNRAFTPVAVYGDHTFCKIMTDTEDRHTIALDNNGQAWCWGNGQYGRLGNNSTLNRCTPVAVCGDHTFCEINIDKQQTFAIDNNGQAWAFGDAYYGRLGNLSATDVSTPVAVCGDHTFCKLYTGLNSKCVLLAIDNNEQAWAWGEGSSGKLGNNGISNCSTPVAVCGNHTFCKIEPHDDGLLTIDNYGQAWTWGYNYWGIVGDNSTTNRQTPVAVCGDHTFCKITVRDSAAIALDNNGQAWAWGNNATYGRLGDNTTTNRSTPVAVCGDHTFCKIYSGEGASYAIDNHGLLWSWGRNDTGVLGNDTCGTHYCTPVAICGGHTFCEILNYKYAYTLGLDNHGQVWCWGTDSGYGVLGINAIECKCEPMAVCGSHTFCTISSGSSGSLAFDNHNVLWSWGSNLYGNVGNNSLAIENIPVNICGGHTFCEIVAREDFSIGLTNKGSAWSWGYNNYGQLGDGTLISKRTPVAVCGDHTFCKINGGASSIIAKDNYGIVWGWGRNWNQVGEAKIDPISPVAVCGDHTFCRISGDGTTLIGIDNYGQAWGWGRNNYGQLGNNTVNNESIPIAVCGSHTFCEVGSSGNTTIALDNNGQAWCWGSGSSGQLGDNTITGQCTPVAVCGDHTFCKVGAGIIACFAVDKDNVCWSWGRNKNLGSGDLSSNQCTPVAVYGDHTFCVIASGGNPMAIDNNGQAWTWGDETNLGYLGTNYSTTITTPKAVCGGHTATSMRYNGLLDSSGQAWVWGSLVGDNTSTIPYVPTAVCGDHTFCQISCYYNSHLGLDNNGQAWSWGTNNYGHIGDNSIFTQKSTPVAVCGGHTFCVVEAHLTFKVALDNNGQAWGWGNNSNGRLGDNTTTNRYTPVAVCGGHTFCSIIPSNDHVIAIDNNGQAWAWGYNYHGRLGDGTTTSRRTPIAVCGAHTFCTVARSGYLTSVCIDNNGQAWTWGSNQYGRLGDNTVTTRCTPVAVCGGHTFCKVAVGYYNMVAIDNNNAVWGWGGYSSSYILEGGGYSSTPVAIFTNKAFCDVALGAYSSQHYAIAIDSTGDVFSWGEGLYGQLGQDIQKTRPTPVAVCGNHTFCTIKGSDYHSLALDNNGQAWSWGNNYSGRLGDNTTICRCTPVAVCGSHTFCEIAVQGSVDNHGQVWAWGGKKRIVGSYADGNFLTPISVYSTFNHTFCEIIVLDDTITCIDNSKKAWSWGYGIYGELGNASSVYSCIPVQNVTPSKS